MLFLLFVSNSVICSMISFVFALSVLFKFVLTSNIFCFTHKLISTIFIGFFTNTVEFLWILFEYSLKNWSISLLSKFCTSLLVKRETNLST